MSNELTKTVHVPLSEYTVAQLHAKASDLREMAITARTSADVQGLQVLSTRFDELAERREIGTCAAHRPVDSFTSPPAHEEMPLGMPSPEALQMAAEAMGKHYIMPETMDHPAIRSACMRLAYTLMAFGLVPSKAKNAVPQPVVAAAARFVGKNFLDQPRYTAHEILVVDDVTDVLVTVGAFLTTAGFAVCKAADGDEALRMIASDPRIDVLVTDFAMPGLSGADLIAQAGQVRPNLKSLVITGYPNADGLAELAPNTKILVKPFRRDTLIASVKSLLGEMPMIPAETGKLVGAEPIGGEQDREGAGMLSPSYHR